MAQQALTGKTAEEAIAGLSRDASLGDQALEHVDLEKLRSNAEFAQSLKGAVYQAGTYFTDDAYKTMFVKQAKVYEVQRDENGQLIRDENDKPVLGRPLTDEEKMNLQPGRDGLVYIANNGIFNDAPAAENYAYQHSQSADGPQYFIDFPIAGNSLSELLVAAYQKNLENDFLGLANATQEVKSMMLLYGQDGLHLDGHSRGAMTVGNALESIAKMPGSAGYLSNTTISFYGPAYNASAADQLLSYLQGYSGVSDPSRSTDMVLIYENHIADPVGTYVGKNPPTGGTVPDGTGLVEQMFRAATGQQNTSHNCYGNSESDKCHQFWQDTKLFPVPASATGNIK